MSWIAELKFDGRGLLPVVAQDTRSGEVLMLAYANRDALERTVATGQAHYWSRSRREIWRKGATSGHSQEVVDVRADCDGDAVLYRVWQTGPACHTGRGNCFARAVRDGALVEADGAGHILARVEALIYERERERPEASYTTYLLEQGIDKALKKLGEESAETIIAAKNSDPAELRAEAADLIFHLLVVLRMRGLPLGELWGELEERFGAAPRVREQRSRPPA